MSRRQIWNIQVGFPAQPYCVFFSERDGVEGGSSPLLRQSSGCMSPRRFVMAVATLVSVAGGYRFRSQGGVSGSEQGSQIGLRGGVGRTLPGDGEGPHARLLCYLEPRIVAGMAGMIF